MTENKRNGKEAFFRYLKMLLDDDESRAKHYSADSNSKRIKFSFSITVKLLDEECNTEKSIKKNYGKK